MPSTGNTVASCPHRKFQSTASKSLKTSSSSSTSPTRVKNDESEVSSRCRGKCRVQWSEKHVKEGLVLVQESQLATVVKTGPISDHYEIDPEPFASGQWARVYRCRSRSTGILYAAKYSSRSRFNTDCSAELRHEIALLSLCSQSPRVVRLHDVYETPKEIILVMEFAPGGDLQTLIDGDLVPLEGDVVHFVKQLVEGLAYLHERNIAHLDIKPQNLVMMGSFPESQVKLCDFEISRVILEGSQVREILGTPDYVAPEILHYEPITLAADMWSLGVTTYVLLTGFSPFGGETDQETFENISQGEVDFPEELFEEVSTQARDFVAKLLVLDPSARMSPEQCLRHDWLRDAPTQASPHLRRYLSKSREVLLERVVSRENLRRAALLSQATSHANLTMESGAIAGTGCSNHEQSKFQSLSQSEMCLNYGSYLSLTASRTSLADSSSSEDDDDDNDCSSEFHTNPASSLSSLNSSRRSTLTSAGGGSGISCLLNKEQTQGLLSRHRGQSRSSRAIFNRTRRGGPDSSIMPTFNRIQACLSTASVEAALRKADYATNSPFGISRSQEKLYGLRSLSKSHGGLDIYRSLECLRYNENKAVDEKIKGHDDDDNDNVQSRIIDDKHQEKTADAELITDSNVTPRSNGKYQEPMTKIDVVVKSCSGENNKNESENKCHSLESVESDTLTEDSDEHRSLLIIEGANRENSNASSSNDSDYDDDSDDDDDGEPKFTVSQLVSAFNKHQEVSSKTSLDIAIMTEKEIDPFPTGPKALRLFVPDIDISNERRGSAANKPQRKTSYKPRKNWQELRKLNEKNEAVLENFQLARSSNCDETTLTSDDISSSINDGSDSGLSRAISEESRQQRRRRRRRREERPLDTQIDVKYKQCVEAANDSASSKVIINTNDDVIIDNGAIFPGTTAQSSRSSRLGSNESFPASTDATISLTNHETSPSTSTKVENSYLLEQRYENCVNLKDILQKADPARQVSKENLEKLRKRTSITKTIINDKQTTVAGTTTLMAGITNNDTNNNNVDGSLISDRAMSEPRANTDVPVSNRKLSINPDDPTSAFVGLSSPFSSENGIRPAWSDDDVGMSWEQDKSSAIRGTSCNMMQMNRSDNFNDYKKNFEASSTIDDKRFQVCTGSYTRAMDKFNGKRQQQERFVAFDEGRVKKAIVAGPNNLMPAAACNSQSKEKTRRKSSPAGGGTLVPPQYGHT